MRGKKMSARHDRRAVRRAVIGLAVAGLAAPALAAIPAGPAAAAAELPVYSVRSAGVTGDQARALQKALGIKDLAVAEDGAVRFADENSFLNVPTSPEGKPGRDEDGNPTVSTTLDVAALLKLRTIDPREAAARTAEALAGAGLTPKTAKLTTGHTTFEAVGAKGEAIASVPLDTTVSYSQTLGGLPYEGPGAKIRVAFGASGQVSQLSYSARTLAAGKAVPVVSGAEAAGRCAKVLGDNARITAADLVYYAPALSERTTRIEPSIRCNGAGPDGAALQGVYLPAALDAKLPEPTPPPPPREPAPGAKMLLPQGPATQAYGVTDVGSEGTGPCSGLPWTGSNLASFNNQFTSRGIPVEFSWLDQNAWEDDFKDPSKGGHDSDWTDHVDMTYWQGHGAPTGFSFSGCSSTDDTFLSNTDARWGNGDVEWMSLFTCLVLAKDDPAGAWWQRWGAAFDGLHQLNSFDTVSYHSASHGGTFANYLLRTPFLWWNNPMPVRSAWAQASIDDQPSSVKWATMGPIGPGGLVNFDDYFWGKGNVGPDIPASQLTGWWYISGTS
jgi:hypothetical protein